MNEPLNRPLNKPLNKRFNEPLHGRTQSSVSKTREVWLVDDDPAILWVMQRSLEKRQMAYQVFASATRCLQAFAQCHPTNLPGVVVSDLNMPEQDGFGLIEQLRLNYPSLPVVLVTAYGDLESAVASNEAGAFEYLTKPFDLDEFIDVVTRALLHNQQRANRNAAKSSEASMPRPATPPQSKSPIMQNLYRQMARVAALAEPVVLLGRDGVGKAQLAKRLHGLTAEAAVSKQVSSDSKRNKFITLVSNSQDPQRIDELLFGSADKTMAGLFEQAEGGTLYCPDISNLATHGQQRIRQTLRAGGYYPSSQLTWRALNCRLIFTTADDLAPLSHGMEDRAPNGIAWLSDFMALDVPDLKQRAEDIVPLILHELSCIDGDESNARWHFDKAALAVLTAYAWPGNLTELKRFCIWLNTHVSSGEVSARQLPEYMSVNIAHEEQLYWQDSCRAAIDKAITKDLISPQQGLADLIISDVEKVLMERALAHCQGHKQRAAKMLGWGRNTLTRKLRQHGLN